MKLHEIKPLKEEKEETELEAMMEKLFDIELAKKVRERMSEMDDAIEVDIDTV